MHLRRIANYRIMFHFLIVITSCFIESFAVCQGRKGEKGLASRAPVIVSDNNGLPTGFIEGPPGPPGQPGIPGKKVRLLLLLLLLSFPAKRSDTSE